MADRYTITERVDQGGMAEVFRGVAESIQGFKKNVAIKRILPTLTKNKKFVSMFLDEARLSLHLQHANIVHVFDIGMGADTAYFIVMEYVDGANLKYIVEYHRKHNKRIKISQVLYILLEVCKGLAYAHDAQDPENGKHLGIVHRDISPPNILISKMGEVKLVDFGLAKATSQLESTDPGVVKGKFSYLSPEAASGVEVDHRADIFAVGILLWEMLTGKRLFYGETDYQTVELVRQAKVPPIHPLNSDVSADLEAVVRKALERDPRDRYQHAGDLGDAIAQILFSRGLKVTSRDVAHLVKEVVADREKNKPANKQKNLLDVLIREEIAKFTSLDALGPNAQDMVGASPLSPEEVGGGRSPLDPGNFVDTRGWADDLGEEGEGGGRKPSGVRGAAKRPSRSADVSEEIDSLQQILEPDRTGVKDKPTRSMRGLLVFLVVAVVVGALGGGLYLFKDRIFSSSETPTQSK